MKQKTKVITISIAQGSALLGMSPQLLAKRVARGDVPLVSRRPKKLVLLDDVLKYAKTVKVGAPKSRKPTAISKLFADPLCLAQIRGAR
jgi:hypothetical protein